MNTIKVTEAAINELKKVKAENSLDEKTFVRVAIRGGGCSGFEYALGFDDKFDDSTDNAEEIGGINFVVDHKSAMYLEGTTLDWQDELSQRGFKFDNPNAWRSCGCGKSFCPK